MINHGDVSNYPQDVYDFGILASQTSLVSRLLPCFQTPALFPGPCLVSRPLPCFQAPALFPVPCLVSRPLPCFQAPALFPGPCLVSRPLPSFQAPAFFPGPCLLSRPLASFQSPVQPSVTSSRAPGLSCCKLGKVGVRLTSYCGSVTIRA